MFCIEVELILLDITSDNNVLGEKGQHCSQQTREYIQEQM